MFERFTDRARKALASCREEALAAGSPSMGTDHLLLGILKSGGKGAEILGMCGLHPVSAGAIRRMFDKGCADAPRDVAFTQIPFSPKLKLAIERAGNEAPICCGVGTEHLLLGLTGDPDGLGYRLLEAFGVKPAMVVACYDKWLTPGAASVMARYSRDGEVRHHGDCRFWGAYICTCGLLHDLAPFTEAARVYPAFADELALHEDALEALGRPEKK